MELRAMRYFVEVADAGTVSAAAGNLHLTQPGLSRQLRQLERELGVALFDRRSGRLTVSAAGRVLLPRVRDILADTERLSVHAGVLASGRLDRVTIAAPATTLAEVIAPFIATLGPADPTPSAWACDGHEPVAALNAGADLVITNGRPAPPLTCLAIGTLPVWAYLPSEPTPTWHERVDLNDLRLQPLISLPTTFGARQALDAAARGSDEVVVIAIEATSGIVAQALAAAGRGIAIVTDDPRFDLHQLKVVAGGAPVNIHLYAGWALNHPAQATLADLAQRLADHIDNHYGHSAP